MQDFNSHEGGSFFFEMMWFKYRVHSSDRMIVHFLKRSENLGGIS